MRELEASGGAGFSVSGFDPAMVVPRARFTGMREDPMFMLKAASLYTNRVRAWNVF